MIVSRLYSLSVPLLFSALNPPLCFLNYCMSTSCTTWSRDGSVKGGDAIYARDAYIGLCSLLCCSQRRYSIRTIGLEMALDLLMETTKIQEDGGLITQDGKYRAVKFQYHVHLGLVCVCVCVCVSVYRTNSVNIKHVTSFSIIHTRTHTYICQLQAYQLSRVYRESHGFTTLLKGSRSNLTVFEAKSRPFFLFFFFFFFLVSA